MVGSRHIKKDSIMGIIMMLIIVFGIIVGVGFLWLGVQGFAELEIFNNLTPGWKVILGLVGAIIMAGIISKGTLR